jgi:hypothetical protein
MILEGTPETWHLDHVNVLKIAISFPVSVHYGTPNAEVAVAIPFLVYDELKSKACSPFTAQMASLSIRSLIALIRPCRSLASFVVIEQAITALETPQARPRAILLGTTVAVSKVLTT